jgi:WD40 repeat protein
MAYDAFISYSHAADGRLAPAVQSGLQRLARPWYRARALRIFRDDTGLAVNPDLWGSIVRALNDSSWFVLLASPESAASAWVNREIEYWCEHKDSERILPVVTDGRLHWSPRRADFDATLSSALPPALAGRFHEEPRHLDLRWAREETQLDLRHSGFRDAVTELAAPMHGVPKEELESEDVRRHRRTLRLARIAVATLVALLIAALASGGFAIQNARAARRAARIARAQSVTNLSRQLAASALNALSGQQLDLGLLLAVEANHVQSDAQARSSLLAGLLTQPTLRRYLYGLQGFPRAVEFSPDGKLLAVSTVDRMQIWDTGSGQLLPQQPDPRDTGGFAAGFAFTPDDKVLAIPASTSSGGVTSRLLDIASGRLRTTQPEGQSTQPATQSYGNAGLATSPDGRVLAVANSHTTTIFETASGHILHTFAGGANALAFSPDGSLLASGLVEPLSPFINTAYTLTISLRDATSGTLRAPPRRAPGGLSPGGFTTLRLNFSADGRRLTALNVGAEPPVVQLAVSTDVSVTGLKLPTLATGDLVIAISPDGRLLASRAGDGTVQVWDAATGAALGGRVSAPLIGGMAGVTETASFSPDGSTLAVAAADGTMRLLATQPDSSLARVVRIDTPPNPSAVELSPTGETAAIGNSSTAEVFDLRPPTPVAREAIDPARTDPRLWSGRPERPLGPVLPQVPPGCTAPADASAMSPDGNLVALACRGFDGDLIQGKLTVWDLRTHRPRAGWPTITDIDKPTQMAFSPDGRTLALAGPQGNSATGKVALWSVTSARNLSSAPGTRADCCYAVQFSPDGRVLAWAEDRQINLWDTARGRPIGESLAAQGVRRIAFSPDGRTLAAGGYQGVSLWDVGSGLLMGKPLPFGATSTSLSSAEGTTSINGLVFLRSDALVAAAVLATTTSNRSHVEIVTWDLRSDVWARLACRVANRRLSIAEWRQYMGSAPYRPVCGAVPPNGGRR